MNPPSVATAETAEPRDTGIPGGGTEELISGSEAIAHAVRLADVDVLTAYPIRPYDTVMQYVSQMIANGDFDCEYIVAESEHSQFEIVKHALAVGARVFVGSSGVGWFYAMEPLAVTAGLRLPMVAMVGNRALDDPGAFGVEHNDALAVRDLFVCDGLDPRRLVGVAHRAPVTFVGVKRSALSEVGALEQTDELRLGAQGDEPAARKGASDASRPSRSILPRSSREARAAQTPSFCVLGSKIDRV